MPFAKSSGPKSEIDQKLKTKRQLIIEQERIRILGDSLMLFYDKLMENYILSYPIDENDDDIELKLVKREEIENIAREYAATKPTGY